METYGRVGAEARQWLKRMSAALPEEQQTAELCQAAVEQDWQALEYASAELRGDRVVVDGGGVQDWKALR